MLSGVLPVTYISQQLDIFLRFCRPSPHEAKADKTLHVFYLFSDCFWLYKYFLGVGQLSLDSSKLWTVQLKGKRRYFSNYVSHFSQFLKFISSELLRLKIFSLFLYHVYLWYQDLFSVVTILLLTDKIAPCWEIIAYRFLLFAQWSIHSCFFFH